MKERHLKYISVAALIAVALLQIVWILHTYNLQRRDIKAKVDDLFFEAAEIELYAREDTISVPVGTVIEAGVLGAKQDITTFVLFQEFTFQYNSEISFSNLDSIFNEQLNEHGLSLRASTYLVEMDSLEASRLQKEEAGFIGAIKTNLLPIRRDGTQYIQAAILNPYKMVLTRIALLVVATLGILLFVVYCIILQIRIIVRQNRIAQLRSDFSNAMIHDMKTPLASILVGTRVLDSGTLDNNPEKKKSYLRIMTDEVNHLLGLVNRILTIAKLESRTIALEK